MKYNFDEVIDRHDTFSCKFMPEFLPSKPIKYPDIISLFVAEMDFRCSQGIHDALQKVVDMNMYGYTTFDDDQSNQRFYNAVIRWYQKQYGWALEKKNIIHVEGALDAARVALQTFTKPGDGVIVNRPVYHAFEHAVIQRVGRTVVNSPLKRDENNYYTIDFEDLERKASDPNVTAYLICSPHNPVGRVWSEEEIIRIYDICRRNNVLMIVDEVHADFIRKGLKFVSFGKVTGGKGVITCSGVGKTFNLAQMCVGQAIITDEDLIEKFRDTAPGTMSTWFAYEAAIAAYTQSDDWYEQVSDYIDGNIDALLEFLKKRMPKVKCYRPEGSYIMWLDFTAYGISDDEIHRRIYDTAGVILQHGTLFDPEGSVGFQRVNMPSPRAKILEGFERIAKEFDDLA